MAVSPIPEGYHNLTPYLVVEDASRAIEFYKDAFGADEVVRMDGPGGSVAHAELQLGDSKLMLSDPFPQSNVRPPSSHPARQSDRWTAAEGLSTASRELGV